MMNLAECSPIVLMDKNSSSNTLLAIRRMRFLSRLILLSIHLCRITICRHCLYIIPFNLIYADCNIKNEKIKQHSNTIKNINPIRLPIM